MMGSVSYAQATRPDTGKIRKLIENSLQYDWIIKVEYADEKPGSSFWQQWDKTFFAVRSAEAILKAVTDCYKQYPDRTIRIYAEKVRPQTCMLYTVYQPRSSTGDAILAPWLTTLQNRKNADHTVTPVRLATDNLVYRAT